MQSSLELIQSQSTLSTNDFWELYRNEKSKDDRDQLLWARCATDLELFCELYFPHYCTREFNTFHRDFFSASEYGERAVRRVRAAPRGSAKSTLASLIKPIHDVCYGLEKFILIVSNTEPLATAKLKDIRNEVLTNRELADTYQLRFPVKKPGETAFTVISSSGECYFMAFGRGAQVRGVRINQYRPTKVICDDVEHSDEVQNERIRLKTNDWFFEDVVKVGDTGTNIEFVGTVLHKQALLPGLIRNPAYEGKTFQSVVSWSERQDLWDQWTKIYTNLDNPNRSIDAESFFIGNSIEMLKGTEVLWPEKEDYLALMKELVEIGKRAFMKEKQNDPQGSTDAVFETFHWYKEVKEGFKIESTGAIVPWNQLSPAFMTVDPSTGQVKPRVGKGLDFTCMLVGYKDHQGRVFAHQDFTKRMPPTSQIQQIFELWERYKLEKVGVETNLYRNLLMPNILDEKKRRDKARGEPMKVVFYDIEQTENKIERIFRLEPKVNHGWIMLNRALSETFRQQLEDFPNADHDDCPDTLEMLWMMAHKQYKAAGLSINAMNR